MSNARGDNSAPTAEARGAESVEKAVHSRRSNPKLSPGAIRVVTQREYHVLDEESFRHMIAVERKRSERSGQPLLLVLLQAKDGLPASAKGSVLEQILAALSLATRETDVAGWYQAGSVIGVMFPEISQDDRGSILGAVMSRVSQTLRDNLSAQTFSQIGISHHVFPEEWRQEAALGNPALYPDLAHRHEQQKSARMIKRWMDISVSALALLFLSPLFLLAAILVKLSSKGPILFRQERLGEFGKSFTFLKFRSMYVNNDRRIHEVFIKSVIKGEHDGGAEGANGAVYKMTDDPRITRIGRILRRTSLDELPQFINVLRGDMSLVGPRPPIPYECEEYDVWHRRRVLEVKPGITGLWQVNGRSRIRFDDMVRLDLQYARTWSIWLDIQILLRTPRALFSDDAF
jgi:lipopolysaccharide/colanic/teichoic acid biosynthesis glycosyltransferase